MESNNKRIAKNTLFLYIRMFLVLLLSLYISRTLLQVLGVEDFGIYNVVGGFVSFFGFLDATLSASMQRFYNIEIGRNMDKNVGRVYKNGIYANIIISLLLFVLLESFGLWYVNNIMVIPADRIIAANILFQIAVVSLVLTLMKIPYVSVILAYEKMGVYSIVIIIDIILKLISVLLLSFVESDSLIVYSVFLLIISTISFLCYYVYTKKRIKSISFCSSYDAELMKSMVTFSGWNLLGTFVYMLKYQGLNLVLNYFFGPVVNAARGIAFQVNSGVSGFSGNVATAFRPQLVNSYASNNCQRTINLMFIESKICFMLIGVLVVPISLKIDFILKVWLGDIIPVFSNIFTTLVLLDLLVCSLNTPCTQVVFATGRLKKYQIASSLVNILLIPFSIIILFVGYSPASVFSMTVVFSILNQMACVYFANEVLYFGLSNYIKEIIIPCLCYIISLYTISYYISTFMNDTWMSLLGISFISVISSFIIGYIIVLNKKERMLVNKYAKC